ncbi:DoxX family protein [Demequina sp. NBRC 110056]|uniref:DoxX family protein n=1 Tax=Demequina sp. NBRC 110056 TaxID=1570345 RepID=UPI000A067537|nr:DoxX family protein [Demequina sp. NBRC 110056]
MTIAYWIVAGILALAFLAAGAQKLLQPESKLRESGVLPERRALGAERGIGAVEVLGALGLILPPLTGVAVVLAPIAAVGLAITMLVAVVNHRQHNEPFVPALGLGVVAAIVAVLGFLAWV